MRNGRSGRSCFIIIQLVHHVCRVSGLVSFFSDCPSSHIEKTVVFECQFDSSFITITLLQGRTSITPRNVVQPRPWPGSTPLSYRSVSYSQDRVLLHHRAVHAIPLHYEGWFHGSEGHGCDRDLPHVRDCSN